MVRIKERYLVVNILYPNTIDTKPDLSNLVLLNQPTTDRLNPQAILRSIRAEVASLFGDYGSGALEGGNLQVKYLSPATSTFILRVNRAFYRIVWTALTFIQRVPVKDGKPCTFRVVHVSGTIRKAEEECIRRARALVIAAEAEASVKGGKALENIFGSSKQSSRDILMVDAPGLSNELSDGEIDEDGSG